MDPGGLNAERQSTDRNTLREAESKCTEKTYSENIFIFSHLHIYKISFVPLLNPETPLPSCLSSPHEKNKSNFPIPATEQPPPHLTHTHSGTCVIVTALLVLWFSERPLRLEGQEVATGHEFRCGKVTAPSHGVKYNLSLLFSAHKFSVLHFYIFLVFLLHAHLYTSN